MANAIDSYGTLYFSPFVLAPLITRFYEKSAPQPHNVLLTYLVLPMVLYPSSRGFLKNAKRTSTLWTFCKERERLYGLANRVQEYRELSSKCLQLAIDSRTLRIESDLSVSFVDEQVNSVACQKDTLTAAKNLAAILSPFDIPTVFRSLGVKRL
jgi:hypothetical protein